KLNFGQYHFLNNKELASSISKLISISMEEGVAKDALADLSLKILLMRIIQTQNLATVQSATLPDHATFKPAIAYISNHLSGKISIDKLASESYMSRSVFFQAFKKHMGISPLEYVQQERIKLAKLLLADKSISVTDACYQSGFNNLNYFIKLFKRMEGVTPNVYRK
ncbi:MAG: AraC family transcriptional regulator, partial [Sphingobacteriales bacterium]